MTPYINIQYHYESGSLADPQLTARITNPVSTDKDQYDLSLVTYSDTAKFNLARLDASGVAGVRNVVVEGDLLTAVSSQAAGFFKYPWPGTDPVVDATPAGIRLPSDDLAGVSIRDYAPNGYVQAKTIQAVAFGSHTTNSGTLETGAAANGNAAGRLLASGTALAQASDTFRVAFADLPAQQAALFAETTDSGGFDNKNLALSIQSLSVANATGSDNIVTPNNTARGAGTALVTLTVTYDKKGHPQSSVFQSVDIRGDGASINTGQWISGPITSTGPLGDLVLSNTSGTANITAPSIFGSILSAGPISGVIQTTGVRVDPITGLTSQIPADFGRLYVSTASGTPQVTTTTVSFNGGVAGQIISRNNLVSLISANGGKGGLTGLIAAQGDLGATLDIPGQPARLGGIQVSGQLSGQVIVLGAVRGDIILSGGLRSGRLAALSGFLGNLDLGTMDSSSAVVSGGVIGVPASGNVAGTAINGTNAGIIAATGTITFGSSFRDRGYTFNNTGTSANGMVISAVFTNNQLPLSFDLSGLDLGGLELIKADILALTVTNQGD